MLTTFNKYSSKSKRRKKTISYILGINSVYHESSACLLKDGNIEAFAEEERFNRVKHAKPARIDNSDELPTNAIQLGADRLIPKSSESQYRNNTK